MSYKYRIDIGTGRLNDPRLYKGGSSSAYYKEANRLYGVQADAADFMLGLGKQYLPDATAQYQDATQRYFDPAYEQRMAGQAAVDAQTAIGSQKAAMTRDMARYGLNPASGRWGSMVNQGAIQGAAMQAGAVNAARQHVQDKQFGASKDFYSSLVGVPSDAANASGSAASGFASMGANRANAAAQDAAGWGQLAGMGIGAYSVFGAKDGGYVPRMAGGGLVGGGKGLFSVAGMPAPPQPTGAPSAGLSGGLAQGAMAGKSLAGAYTGETAKGIIGGLGKAATTTGNLTGNAGLAAQGLGMQGAAAGTDLSAAISAYGDAALAAEGAGEAATAAEMAQTAAGLSEGAGAMSGGLGAVSTALPWAGAAIAIGSIFDLFADGGEVADVDDADKFSAQRNIYEALFGEEYVGAPEQLDLIKQFVSRATSQRDDSDMAQAISGEAVDMQRGGDVRGPGTKTSDSVPARLSAGEFVVNADAVEMPGVRPALEKINAEGLRKRKGYAKGGLVKKGGC